RPNLVPLAAVPLAWILLTTRGPERFHRAGLFCAFVVPVVIGIAALNTAWYGSPVLSGYGHTALLYDRGNIWPNLQRYPVWLWQTQSPGILVAGVSLAALARSSPRRAP